MAAAIIFTIQEPALLSSGPPEQGRCDSLAVRGLWPAVENLGAGSQLQQRTGQLQAPVASAPAGAALWAGACAQTQ